MNKAVNELITQLRDWQFMSGVVRDNMRIKQNGEIFTPTKLVQEMLDNLPEEQFTDKTKTFLDPCCGDGQFLSEVLIRKLENGIEHEHALSTIYGVDIMDDNVRLCRKRLLCDREDLHHIVENNIVCADALTYGFTFGEPHVFGLNDEFELYIDGVKPKEGTVDYGRQFLLEYINKR